VPKKHKQVRNIALCVPQPLVGHEETEEGKVKLLVPRFRGRMMQWLQKRLKNPYLKVSLDEIGSTAWKLMNGSRNIVAIGEELEKALGEKVQPVHERLGLFFGSLKKNRFVDWEYVVAPGTEDDSAIEPK
jgi:hypothetical protein